MQFDGSLLDSTVPIHKSHTNKTCKRYKWLKLILISIPDPRYFEENCGEYELMQIRLSAKRYAGLV